MALTGTLLYQLDPTCNILVYLFGPVAMAAPPWLGLGVTVTAVLLLTARERLHALAHRMGPRKSSPPASF